MINKLLHWWNIRHSSSQIIDLYHFILRTRNNWEKESDCYKLVNRSYSSLPFVALVFTPLEGGYIDIKWVRVAAKTYSLNKWEQGLIEEAALELDRHAREKGKLQRDKEIGDFLVQYSTTVTYN